VATFKPKDVDYPRTYFVLGEAIRLAPGETYETDDGALIAALEQHGQLEKARPGRPRSGDEPEVEAEAVADEPEAEQPEAEPEPEDEVDYWEQPKTELEREARERGIYDSIEGSGAGGGITKQDIVDALEEDDG